MRLSGEALKNTCRKARQRFAVPRNIEIRFSLKEKLEYRVCKWFSVFVMCSDPDEVSERVSQKT